MGPIDNSYTRELALSSGSGNVAFSNFHPPLTESLDRMESSNVHLFVFDFDGVALRGVQRRLAPQKSSQKRSYTHIGLPRPNVGASTLYFFDKTYAVLICSVLSFKEDRKLTREDRRFDKSFAGARLGNKMN